VVTTYRRLYHARYVLQKNLYSLDSSCHPDGIAPGTQEALLKINIPGSGTDNTDKSPPSYIPGLRFLYTLTAYGHSTMLIESVPSISWLSKILPVSDASISSQAIPVSLSFEFLSPADVGASRNPAKKPAENDFLKLQQKRSSFQLKPKSLF